MAILKETLMWTTYILLLKTCASSVISNSTCGPNYPYSKCYNQYKIFRIHTPEDDKINLVNDRILNKLDIDAWSYPTNDQNGTKRHFDVMVSPNVEEKVQNVLLSNQIRSSILHKNVNDLIMKEVKMVCIHHFIAFEMRLRNSTYKQKKTNSTSTIEKHSFSISDTKDGIKEKNTKRRRTQNDLDRLPLTR